MSAYYAGFDPEVGRDWATDQGRDYATKKIIGALLEYEIETAGMMEGLLENNADVKARRDELLANGYSEGDSALKAAEEVLGREKFLKMKHDLPGHKNLDKMKSKVERWKERN